MSIKKKITNLLSSQSNPSIEGVWMRMYIADDNQDFLDIVRVVAEREGWKTTSCTNGRELALQVGLEGGAALLVIDIDMPEIDGIEVIEYIKTINRKMRVRFITGGPYVSAIAARMIAEARGLEVGPFIQKPVAVSDLKAILKTEAGLLYEQPNGEA